MSEPSYWPFANRDALSNKLQRAKRELYDSLRRGPCSGLSSYPRSRRSDHIKNLQRFPDIRKPDIFLRHRQLAVEGRPVAVVRDSHLQSPFQVLVALRESRRGRSSLMSRLVSMPNWLDTSGHLRTSNPRLSSWLLVGAIGFEPMTSTV